MPRKATRDAEGKVRSISKHGNKNETALTASPVPAFEREDIGIANDTLPDDPLEVGDGSIALEDANGGANGTSGDEDGSSSIMGKRPNKLLHMLSRVGPASIPVAGTSAAGLAGPGAEVPRSLLLNNVNAKDPSTEEEFDSDTYGASWLRSELWQYFYHAVAEEDLESCNDLLESLFPMERFWGVPGVKRMKKIRSLLNGEAWDKLHNEVTDILAHFTMRLETEAASGTKTRFDVLFVQPKKTGTNPHLSVAYELLNMPYVTQDANAQMVYDFVVVNCFEEAMIAVLFNHDIQAVVIDSEVEFGEYDLANLDFLQFLPAVDVFIRRPLSYLTSYDPPSVVSLTADCIKEVRPEVDAYVVSDNAVDRVATGVGKKFRRVFAALDDHMELHYTITEGVKHRLKTPFFTSLKSYSEKPVGVFHAMALSRGNSILKSRWHQQFLTFYGRNIFKAESSATCGGLDSLLEPTGPIKEAQELAAEAFGADHTFFVTNGTSTGNKIVLQAILQPGDIAMIDRECHKSHHYAIVLSGAHVCYLDAYALDKYCMYGAVPIKTIKMQLLRYKRSGELHRVKMICLTNCTFDGVVYNVEQVMMECLAIKPDLVFVWDEAWYAYAFFSPIYRNRCGMGAAARLRDRLDSERYARRYSLWREKYGDLLDSGDSSLEDVPLWANPDDAKIRVYVTQSTHKSLTALRQGSMIHVNDEEFGRKVEHSFREAYFTHTSTSPNYQILASLDVGRSQMQLEGYSFLVDMLECAMLLRRNVHNRPTLSSMFSFLDVGDMIPEEYRKSSNISQYVSSDSSLSMCHVAEAFLSNDEFVLDPTRLTLFTGKTGIEGDDFKKKWLMDKYDIQVNKTSRNSVLFQTNIGTTTSATGYLLQSLDKIVEDIHTGMKGYNYQEQLLHKRRVTSLLHENPALPHFSRFSDAFRGQVPGSAYEQTGEGDMRTAYFLAYDENRMEYVTLQKALELVRKGEELVGSTFVIPYPPGFPVIVPGQVINEASLTYLIETATGKEVHGFRQELGLRVFKKSVIDKIREQMSKVQPLSTIQPVKSFNNLEALNALAENDTADQLDKLNAARLKQRRMIGKRRHDTIGEITGTEELDSTAEQPHKTPRADDGQPFSKKQGTSQWMKNLDISKARKVVEQSKKKEIQTPIGARQSKSTTPVNDRQMEF